MASHNLKLMTFIAAVLALCSLHFTSAATFTVGDTRGWNPDYDFKQWVNLRKFGIGDVLVFHYDPHFHNVVKVSTYDEYQSCDSGRPIYYDDSGRTAYTLEKFGTHYFFSNGTRTIFSNGTTDDCSRRNLKVSVPVDH